MRWVIIIACLFLLVSFGQAQVQMQGKGTGNTISITNDAATIQSWMSDSLAILADSILDVQTIRTDITEAKFTAMFDRVHTDTNWAFIFEQAQYNFTNEGYGVDGIRTRGLRVAEIDLNGATINLNDNVWYISAQTSNYWTFINSSIAKDWNDGTFLTDIEVGDNTVTCSDATTDLPGVEQGDIMIIEDRTEGEGAGNSPIYIGVVESINYGTNVVTFFNRARYRVETDSLSTRCRYINTSKTQLVLKNGYIIDGAVRVGGYEKVTVQNVQFYNTAAGQQTYVDAGLQLSGCVEVNVINCWSDNFTKNGVGYGFGVSYGHQYNIINSFSYNCRHAFTATTVNEFNIYNCYARTTPAARALHSNSTAFDTHNQVMELNVSNSFVDGFLYMYYMRGEDATFDNVRVRNCDRLMMTAALSMEEDEGQALVIKNSRFENSPNILHLASGVATLTKFEFVDNEYHTGNFGGISPRGGIHFQNQNSSIDTVIIKDNQFYDNGNAGNLIYTGNTNPIDVQMTYCLIDNNVVRGYTQILAVEEMPATNMVVTNNHFENMTRFINWEGGVVSDTSGTLKANMLLHNNTFIDVPIMALTTDNMHRMYNWTISENYFENSSYWYLRNLSMDSLVIINNTFEDCYRSYAPGLFYVESIYGNAGSVVMKGNTFTGNTGTGRIITLVGDANTTPSAYIMDETIIGESDLVTFPYSLSYSEMTIHDTYFNLSGIAASHLVSINDGGTLYFSRNQVNWTSSSQNDLLEVEDAGATVWLDNNTFLLSGHAAHHALHFDLSGTLYLKGNWAHGTSAPLDTTGFDAAGGTVDTLITF